MQTFWDEVKTGTQRALRTLVPKAEDRVGLQWDNAIYPILCYAPLLFMAYLARRQDTYPIRLLMLPTTVSAIFFAAYHFTWTIPELNVYNWGQCLLAAVAISKALEYGFTPEGILKIGESLPGVPKGKQVNRNNDYIPNGYNRDGPRAPPPSATTHSSWFSDAIELLHTTRGLRFKFGQGVYIPPFNRPLDSTDAFLVATLRSLVINYLTLDILESTIKLFPGGIGTPLGGSIFYADLIPVARYAVSTFIHILTGFCLLAGFGMVYDLITFIAVGFFDSSPTSWPPVLDAPWHAESMHELWAKRWHQLLRQTFIVYGGYPGKWLFEAIASILVFFISLPSSPSSFTSPHPRNPRIHRKYKRIISESGKLGMLLGTFVASGLFHECAMYSMDRGFDWVPVAFFASQGPILIGERLWRRITGRRVSGKFGRLWVYFIMFVLAQPMVNSWHTRGLGGGMVIPPFFSLTRILLLPPLQKLLNRL